jgi:acetyl-CoA acyltransferase 2
MRAIDKEIVFLSAKRTAFGTYGGSLAKQSATDLGVHAAEAAIAASKVDKKLFDHVVFGNVLQTSADAIYLARHVGLRSGLPESVPALTVNRLCGSGFQSIINAAELMLTEQAELVLAGGTESMSQAPHVIWGARFGLPLGQGKMVDLLWECLTDSYTGLPMAMTAENLAVEYKISQDEVDAYAVQSQKRFAAAQEAGHFNQEISPVTLKSKKGETQFAKDEHGRADTTLESLKKLPKVFKKDGVIHAGAASGICDGAGAVVMATRAFADKHGLAPIARLTNWGVSGCDPKVMGIGPVPAIKRLFERTGAKVADFDLIEVNEAFAPQALAVIKALDLPMAKTNVNGGALAVGHPLAASGTRIVAHLIHELRRTGQKRGLGSACIGGGQGIAVAVEAL